jgi:hypothetical protein
MPILITMVIGKLPVASQGPAVAEIAYGLLVIIFITSSPQGIVGLLRNLGRSRLLSAGVRRARSAARRPA